MRDSFSRELEILKNMFSKMGEQASKVAMLSVASLKEQDIHKAKEAIQLDGAVDVLEREIENKCMSLIALQHPIAADLRKIGTIMKLITDVERIGDYGVNIAKITISIGDEVHVKPLIDIPKMADIVREMLQTAMKSFAGEDVALARKAIEMDDRVDQLYMQIHQDLQKILTENPKVMQQVTSLLLVSRHLERMADHTTNICERVIFMVTGERVDI